MRTEFQKSSRRVVVKVGTSLLTGPQLRETGGIDLGYIGRLADVVARERQRGRDLVLVTSGAIGAGLAALNLKARPKSLRHLQAAAAIGQGALVHAYAEAFRRHGCVVGQVLLTRDGVEHRERYLNARNTLTTLIEEGVVPIVNENDTVAVDEIRFGDNDTLAALATKLSDADLLVILTDVEGLFTADPRRGDAVLIDEVDEITPEIERYAEGKGTDLASGGMATKIEAARMASAAGAGTILAGGEDPSVLNRLLDGESVGTFFRPKKARMEARKFWIAFATPRPGFVGVNDGARKALLDQGRSLLPVGVVKAGGGFSIGDTVRILGQDGEEFARGIANYGLAEVVKILGRKTGDLPGVLGALYSEDEVIHRDNLVIL